MARSTRILTAAGLALASGAALADPASLPVDDRYDRNDGPDFADVVHVEPIRRQVRVSEPVRECWQEACHASDGPFSYKHIKGTLIGGALGTVVGNQVGRGRGSGSKAALRFAAACVATYAIATASSNESTATT